jgi:hypothetical protein
LLLCRFTAVPPAGAGCVRVIVPVVLCPAGTEAEPRDSELGCASAPVPALPDPVSVNVPVALTPGPVAVTVVAVCVVTVGA